MTRRQCALLFVLWSAAPARAESTRAHELEGRLFAPCCYVQTLDVHESQLATELRGEIRTRLERDESAQRIEDDLAVRYGERIRAVPRGRDPRRTIPFVIGGAMALAIVALVMLGLRWIRRPTLASADEPQLSDGAYDAALDAELRRTEVRGD